MGRWVDNDENKIAEHRHGHYDWHFVHTRHRPMRLDVDYPEVNKVMRSRSFRDLSIFAPFLMDKLIEDHNVGRIGAMADKRGGPLEIYLDKLLEDAAKLGYNHWGWDIFDDVSYDEELRDLISIILFWFCHDCYYIHEILHRMWQWETSHRQNKKRGKDKEEEIVKILSYAINTHLYDHLFKASHDVSWENYRKMLREAPAEPPQSKEV